MRTHLCAVLAACLLSGCASAAGPVPRQVMAQRVVPPRIEPAPAPVQAPVAAPPGAAASLNLADYIYGPPPRTRVDRRLRCRFDCPAYPPGTLFAPPR